MASDNSPQDRIIIRPEDLSSPSVDCEASTSICSICQCPVEPHDEVTECNACGLPFHQECWEENQGCAAYGCRNVHALKQGPDISVHGQELPRAIDAPALLPDRSTWRADSMPGNQMPWEFLFLAGSVIAALISMVTFGLPSLAVATSAGVFAVTAKKPEIPILLAVWVVSGLAFFVGFVLSGVLWSR